MFFLSIWFSNQTWKKQANFLIWLVQRVVKFLNSEFEIGEIKLWRAKKMQLHNGFSPNMGWPSCRNKVMHSVDGFFLSKNFIYFVSNTKNLFFAVFHLIKYSYVHVRKWILHTFERIISYNDINTPTYYYTLGSREVISKKCFLNKNNFDPVFN